MGYIVFNKGPLDNDGVKIAPLLTQVCTEYGVGAVDLRSFNVHGQPSYDGWFEIEKEQSGSFIAELNRLEGIVAKYVDELDVS